LVKCNISISSFSSKKENTRLEEAGVAQKSKKQSEQESLSSKADTSVSLSLILNQRQKAHEQKMYRWLPEQPKEKLPSLYTDFLNDAAKIISQDRERPNPKTQSRTFTKEQSKFSLRQQDTSEMQKKLVLKKNPGNMAL
jgi:hypothetical protein